MDSATEYAMAYALTTTAGVRAFLALLVAAIAAHAGWIHLTPQFGWLGSTGSIVILSVFALLEILGDKIPVVDNALHLIYFIARPAAAAIIVGGTVHTPSNVELIALMVAGALNAFVVHGSIAAVRATSTATTFGTGNAALSVAEDAIAIGGGAASIAFPIAAGVIALLFVAALVLAVRLVVVRRPGGSAGADFSRPTSES